MTPETAQGWGSGWVSGSVVCHRQFKELWRGRDGTGRSRSLIREVNLANGFRCVEKFCMTEEKKLEGKC
jgi:hypothetical protein